MTPAPAPRASFSNADGRTVMLSELLGQRTIVLYFYPKDDTPGCTAEACMFRDHYEDFKDAGAEVVGVSSDDGATHDAFKERHRLPFLLLTDPKGGAAKAFGVKKAFGLLPGRVTFVIDRGGIIRHRFDSQLRVHKHVEEALEIVRALEAG
ncbi:MAG: peroxiredoxin [Gammaproteobacteria bacterium]|nr:peroxiredoxin [Gammaproteobacteria bacterium]